MDKEKWQYRLYKWQTTLAVFLITVCLVVGLWPIIKNLEKNNPGSDLFFILKLGFPLYGPGIVIIGLAIGMYFGTKTADFKFKVLAEREKEKSQKPNYQKSGISLIALGLLHLIIPQYLLWPWGLVLIVAGITNLMRPQPKMILIDGILVCVAGLWNLLACPLGPFTILAVLQFGWAIQKIRQYRKLEKQYLPANV